MSKLALCFLVTRNLENLEVWEEWIKGHEDKVKIYAHYDKKGVTHKILTRNKIKKTIKTKWGNLSLVKAERNLYEEALKHKPNKYFILLSESCIPVRSFSYIYNRLMKQSKGIMSYHKWDPYDHQDNDLTPFKNRNACKRAMKDFGFFDGNLYTSDQWKILSRKNVQDFIKMFKNHEYIDLFKAFCIEVVPDSVAPDELMFINYLKWKYGNISSQVRQGVVTFVDFNENSAIHAKKYKTLSKNLQDWICDINAMFARKFIGAKPRNLKRKLPLIC